MVFAILIARTIPAPNSVTVVFVPIAKEAAADLPYALAFGLAAYNSACAVRRWKVGYGCLDALQLNDSKVQENKHRL